MIKEIKAEIQEKEALEDYFGNTNKHQDYPSFTGNGIIAEDGLSRIKCQSEERGFKHFIYQTFLKRIKSEGALLAAISRNSPSDALEPLKKGDMILNEEDFVTVIASYEAKSSQILLLAKSLNILLDSFVFVDDSELEIEEVKAKLPQVKCYNFPKSDFDLPNLIYNLSKEFTKIKRVLYPKYNE